MNSCWPNPAFYKGSVSSGSYHACGLKRLQSEATISIPAREIYQNVFIWSTNYTARRPQDPFHLGRSDSAYVSRPSSETHQSKPNLGDQHHQNILVPQLQGYRTEPPAELGRRERFRVPDVKAIWRRETLKTTRSQKTRRVTDAKFLVTGFSDIS